MKHKMLLAVSAPEERNALHRLLQLHFSEDLTIFCAGSGHDALDVFIRENPSIAILDIEMQDVSGILVAEQIRAFSRTCSLLFLAQSHSFASAKQAIDLHAIGFLLKPYDAEHLLHSVQEAIAFARHFENPIWEQTLDQLQAADRQAGTTENIRLTLVRADIQAFIDAHYMEELSMKSVARAMNYSDAYFCKLFKQCFQVNFSTYINAYRIEKAKQMIKNPRISIKDIGTACGYTDANYFTRVFKRTTGQTPSEYRLSLMDKNRRSSK